MLVIMYAAVGDAGSVGQWSRHAAVEAGISATVSLPGAHLSGMRRPPITWRPQLRTRRGTFVTVLPFCLPRVGSGAVRIVPLRFLTGCSKSRTKSGFRLFC